MRSSWGGGKRNLAIFEAHRAKYFIIKFFLMVKPCRALAVDIKSFIISALVIQQTRLKISILVNFFSSWFGHQLLT